MKKVLIIVLLLLVCGLGSYVAYDLYQKNAAAQAAKWEEEALNQRLRREASIIERFQSKKELITLEAELSDTLEWDDSWGTFDVFHKSQKIRFYGIGLYITDLNEIKKEDISVDLDNRNVTVTIPKPIIKSVTIDDEKTEYEGVEKGWFRFGDISLKPEQYNAVYATVKDNMMRSLESPDFYKQAEQSTREAAADIFQMAIDSLEEDYTVLLRWKTDED